MTFGIAPTAPETGYGYIQRGAPLEEIDGVCAVKRFAEKPDTATAETLPRVWRLSLEQRHVRLPRGCAACRACAILNPALSQPARAALAAAKRDLDFVRLDAAAFEKARNISIDYAVMEKTGKAAVVPCDIGWSDVGAWSSLWSLQKRDAQRQRPFRVTSSFMTPATPMSAARRA